MSHCQVAGCDRPATHAAKTLCVNCYQGLYYWSRQGPTRAVKHQRKLAMLAARMELATNVKLLRRKRAA